MPAPKLTEEQRNTLIGWLAAEYTEPAIRRFLTDRGWPVIDGSSIQHYRDRYRDLITEARLARRESALNSGLAIKEERVARLAAHADELDEIKWVPDEKGRLWNEKAWRETLDDIAREMGQRKAGVEVSGPDGGAIEYRHVSDARQELGTEIARTLGAFGAGEIDPAPEPEGGADPAL